MVLRPARGEDRSDRRVPKEGDLHDAVCGRRALPSRERDRAHRLEPDRREVREERYRKEEPRQNDWADPNPHARSQGQSPHRRDSRSQPLCAGWMRARSRAEEHHDGERGEAIERKATSAATAWVAAVRMLIRMTLIDPRPQSVTEYGSPIAPTACLAAGRPRRIGLEPTTTYR